MHHQSQRPDSPSEQYAMYNEFEPEKRASINGYHRSSFTAIPNATRSSRHHPTPSSTLPSTNPTMYRDAAAYQPDPYGLSSPTQSHMQPAFIEPPRGNYSGPFLSDSYANYAAKTQPPHPQSQSHALPHSVNAHTLQLSSQTPYGPHLPSSGASIPVNGGHNGGSVGGGNNGSGMQEDISTIFVVGFPDDMQEREFQNMFTFSSGFEAATLKIPNKEYTAYGLPGPNTSSAPPSVSGIALNPNSLATLALRNQAAANDPYNLVTAAQGGTIVHNGRDGGTASWPAAPQDDSYYSPISGLVLGGLIEGVGGPGNSTTLGPNPNPNATGVSGTGGPVSNNGPVPPRKQIIGFAKFRTRDEALAARDVLQGRRVDIERGAVLKAEMAKKNLHTKRGVTAAGSTVSNLVNGVGATPSLGHSGGLGGSSGSGLLGGAGLGFAGNSALQQYDMYPPAPSHSHADSSVNLGGMSARERELGTLGAMGFTSVPSGGASAAGLPASTASIARIWGGKDEDERERKAGGSSGDESSGPGPVSAKEGGRRRVEGKTDDGEKQPLRLRSGSAFDAFHSVPASFAQSGLVSPPLGKSGSMGHDDGIVGPWDHFSKAMSHQPPSSKASHTSSTDHSRSSRSSSVAAGSTHSTHSPKEVRSIDDDDDVHTNPEMDPDYDPNTTAREIDVGHIARAVGSLALNTNSSVGVTSNGTAAPNGISGGANPLGNTSPQLPSPSSGSGASASAHSAGGTSVVSASGISAAISNSSSSSSLRHAASTVHSHPPCPHPTFTSPHPPSNLSHLTSALSSSLPALSSGVDQNPPINTLYVGNLPISPPPLGYPPDILEESLRGLFRTRPGFRRLSFKQKSSGPMCFVEFEDVSAATKTIQDLYGNTLGGLVKGGGIRLSYSKNPLGVRTPTSANGPGPSLQQQHLLQPQIGRDIERERDNYSGGTFGGVQTLSPTPHHHSSASNHVQTHPNGYMMSPPPPRFAGTSPSTTMSNVSFSNNFSSQPYGGVGSGAGAGSGSGNFLFGTANSFHGSAGSGLGYRSSDTYGDSLGPGAPHSLLPSQGPSSTMNASFSPFDVAVTSERLMEHPQMPQVSALHLPMQYQGSTSSQNQNF